MYGTDFCDSKQGSKAGCCEEGSDFADFMKFEEYIFQLNKYQLIKK